MKNKILKAIYMVSYYLGIIRLFYFLNKEKQIIITYHNVIPDDLFDENLIHFGVSCNESSFMKQLGIVNKRFKIVTEIGLPGTCIITFDDGYYNNYKVATQLLKKNNWKAIFFIPACYFEGIDILWIDKLLMWVSYVPVGNYSILGKSFFIDQNSRSRRNLWEYLYKNLLSNYSIINSLITELNSYYPFSKLITLINEELYESRFRGISHNEVLILAKMGHKIGCHSFKHDILSLLTDKELIEDFNKCIKYFDKYNTKIYSYPFGGPQEVSKAVIDKCKEYGFTSAVMNYETKKNTNTPYTLGRISLDTLNDKYFIEARLSRFEKFLKKIVR